MSALGSSRAGAAPQGVVGQLQCGIKDAHARARVYHTQRVLRGRGVRSEIGQLRTRLYRIPAGLICVISDTSSLLHYLG